MGLRGTRKQESRENYIMRSFMIFPPHQICLGYQIEQNEKGSVCSTYGERRGVYRVLVWDTEGMRPLKKLGDNGG